MYQREREIIVFVVVAAEREEAAGGAFRDRKSVV
jgi:hypothetical protein